MEIIMEVCLELQRGQEIASKKENIKTIKGKYRGVPIKMEEGKKVTRTYEIRGYIRQQ